MADYSFAIRVGNELFVRSVQSIDINAELVHLYCDVAPGEELVMVKRSALIGMGEKGRQTPVICIELEATLPSSERERIEAELINLGQRHPRTRAVQHILFHPGFPVDIRHNAKIGREALTRWAAKSWEPPLPPR